MNNDIELTEGYAEVNNLRLHYAEAGQGPVMLFLHGFPQYHGVWHRQLAEFSRDHRAIAVDMRGYNKSSKPVAVEAYNSEHLISDIRALLEQFSPGQPAILVGHDWGGIVAWAAAATHPELLAKLVIINAPHPTIFARELAHNPEQQKASRYIGLFASPVAEATLSAFNHAALAKVVFEAAASGSFSDEEKAGHHEAWSQEGALTGGLNYYRTMRGADDGQPHPDLTVHIPTLLIWAEADTALLTGNLEGVEQYVPDLQIRRIPGASHWVIHEQPELVNRYIREFIEQ